MRFSSLNTIVVASVALFAAEAAATNVTGNLTTDTNWTLANSPYVVTGSVMVDAGVTLTIEPGVQVRFNAGKALEIWGTLVARGTAGNEIVFTSNQATPAPGDWGYILFEDTSSDAVLDGGGNYLSGSVLEHAVVEYGSQWQSYGGALSLSKADPLINYVTVRDGSYKGIYVTKNGDNTTHHYTITNNVIRDNGATGLDLVISDATDTATVSGNSVSHNGYLDQNNRRGMFLGAGNGVLTVTGNRVLDNASDGVQLGAAYTGNTVFNDNVVMGNGSAPTLPGYYGDTPAGVRLSLSYASNTANVATLSNNLILDNYSWGIGVVTPSSTSYSTTNTVNLTRNIIWGNGMTGVYSEADSGGAISYNVIGGNNLTGASQGVDQGSAVQMPMYWAMTGNLVTRNVAATSGVVANEAIGITGVPLYSATISNNNIFDNTGLYAARYTYWFAYDVNMPNNWWGSAVDADVEAMLWHWVDDSTLGKLLFTPILTAPDTAAPISLPSGVTATVSPGQVALTWNANPEADAAGYKVYWGKSDAPNYDNVVDVGNVTNYTISSLAEGNWYVGVTAYDTSYVAANDVTSTQLNDNQTNGNESWYTQVVANPLTLSATSHDFGSVNTGFNVSYDFTVTNLGYSGYGVNSVALSGSNADQFAVTGDNCSGASLAAGASCTITVTLSPTATGVKSASLVITPTDTNHNSLTASLSGTAVAVADIAPAAMSIDFGNTLVGGAPSYALQLSNLGTATLNLTSSTLGGSNGNEFSLSGSCTTISVGGSCTLTVKHLPVSSGAKSATLTISSNDPDEPAVVIDLAATAVAPVSIGTLSADKVSGIAPLGVQFTAAANGGLGVLSYDWSFGDGSTSTTQNPAHTFTSAGSYTVTLTVTDSAMAGNSASSSLIVLPVSQPLAYSPVLVNGLSADLLSAPVPFTSSFAVSASGGSGSYSYVWNFGDGTTGSGATPSHLYTTAGSYVVSVTVSDAADATNTATVQTVVLAVNPAATYSPVGITALNSDISSAIAPFTPHFSVQAAGGSGSYSYSWNFGDGSAAASGANVTHQFVAAGNYLVTVTVTDGNDTANSTTGTLAIIGVAAPASYSPVVLDALSADIAAGIAPMTVNFALGASGGSGNYLYSWNFGDGSAASTSVAPSHQFTTAGSYVVTVVVKDAADANNLANGSINVLVANAPESIGVALTATQTTGTAPVSVTFNTSLSGGAAPYTLNWNFGDGTTQTQILTTSAGTVTHTYNSAGSYSATLTVTSASGVGTQANSVNTALAISVAAPASSGGGGGGGAVDLSWLLIPLLLWMRRYRPTGSE